MKLRRFWLRCHRRIGVGRCIHGYGKGAIFGMNGEREHTAPVLHPRFGAPVRQRSAGALTSSLEQRKLPVPERASLCRLEIKTIVGFLTTWTRLTCRYQMLRALMKLSFHSPLVLVVGHMQESKSQRPEPNNDK